MLAKQDGGRRFEYTAKTGYFEKSLHLTRTLDARCPNAKFVHKNLLGFMAITIFQLLSCLYFYDSGIEVPVCIRKPSRSTVYQPVAFIYRAVGQQSPGAGVDIPCHQSTDSWQRREVCAKSVDRLPASKGLIDSKILHTCDVRLTGR